MHAIQRTITTWAIFTFTITAPAEAQVATSYTAQQEAAISAHITFTQGIATTMSDTNEAAITQTAAGNWAAIVQAGESNSAAITQNAGNVAGIVQVGGANSAAIIQMGTGNTATIRQK
jgi:hypothetical protein